MIGDRSSALVNSVSSSMVPSGVIILNKPVGPTSHDMVARVRQGTRLKRVGHAGTLDPLASGVLPILLGPATRLSEYLSAHDKHYRATLKFGATSATLDAGSPLRFVHPVEFGRPALESALRRFTGAIEQTPPAYSAIKVKGRKSYEAARAGETLDLAPRKITIHSLEIVSWESPLLVLDVRCSAGTYIRALARDIGDALGTSAYLAGLVRTASGRFAIEDSVTLQELDRAMTDGRWTMYLRSPAEALGDFPAVVLEPDSAQRIAHGNPVTREPGSPNGLVRGLGPTGSLIAVLRPDSTGEFWQPEKVLAADQ